MRFLVSTFTLAALIVVATSYSFKYLCYWPEMRLSGTLDCVRIRASNDLKQGLLNLEAETGCDSGLCIVLSLCANPGLDEGLRKFLTDTQHDEISELLHMCSPLDRASRPYTEQSNMQWILAFFQ
ncbi:uncharacterized protein LOC115315996 [Ixodes scapularis]|uniref:uncharacterized protein LOC115315996 n=1 Tax=Ixodes scapularis TaxID=6945 RepID=UPI001A9F6E4A|nr:uncharacterized protein LOC115315996 [Ixodes scapularis]